MLGIQSLQFVSLTHSFVHIMLNESRGSQFKLNHLRLSLRKYMEYFACFAVSGIL